MPTQYSFSLLFLLKYLQLSSERQCAWTWLKTQIFQVSWSCNDHIFCPMSYPLLGGTSGKGLWKGEDRCSAYTYLLPFTFFLLLGMQRSCRSGLAILCHKHMLRITEQKDRKILSPHWHSRTSVPALDHLTPACHYLRKVKQITEPLVFESLSLEAKHSS